MYAGVFAFRAIRVPRLCEGEIMMISTSFFHTEYEQKNRNEKKNERKLLTIVSPAFNMASFDILRPFTYVPKADSRSRMKIY